MLRSLSSVSFGNCLSRCEILLSVQNVPSCLFPVSPLTPAPQHWAPFCHDTSGFSVLEFLINGIFKYALFCVLFLVLSIVFLRFIHSVCVTSSVLYIAEQGSIHWKSRSFKKTSFPADEHLDCFQFWATMNKTAMYEQSYINFNVNVHFNLSWEKIYEQYFWVIRYF